MGWHLIGSNVLMNTQIPLVIKLIEGSWQKPLQISFDGPINFSDEDNTQYLKEALIACNLAR